MENNFPVTEQITRAIKENPYVAIGAAAAVGYVVAGGLATPFTRRIIRIGMKALFVPLAASQLKGLTAPAGAEMDNE